MPKKRDRPGDRTGEVHGDRVILGRSALSTPRCTKWRWRCSRGHTGHSTIYIIKHARCWECAVEGRRGPRTDYTGREYNDRIIVGPAEGNKWRWECTICGRTGSAHINGIREHGCRCRHKPPTKSEVDRTGEEIGTIVITGPAGKRNKDGHRMWRWECSWCGSDGASYYKSLAGRKKCQFCPKVDYTGKEVGNKRIIEIGKMSSSGRCWKWVCLICGAEGESFPAHIENSSNCKHCAETVVVHTEENMVGKWFGDRKVTGYAGKIKGRRQWHWICRNGHEGTTDTYVIRGKGGEGRPCGQCMHAVLEVFGKKMTYAEVEEVFGVRKSIIKLRLKKGIPLEEILLRGPTPTILKRRLARGWTEKQALETPIWGRPKPD